MNLYGLRQERKKDRLKKAYICSPYRAADSEQLDRNITYAQELTRQAVEAGFAPITPHLYMTQCLNEDDPKERGKGMAAGLELLKCCDCIVMGKRYGISDGMATELMTADFAGIEIMTEERMKEIYLKE